jgi:hypothetical protein
MGTAADKGINLRRSGAECTDSPERLFNFPSWRGRSAMTNDVLIKLADKFADKQNRRAGLDSLARHAEAIRLIRRRVADDIIKVGEHLTKARKLCGHGDWLAWLEREFGWTDDTAHNFMQVHLWADANPERVRNLELPLRSIYLLARPSTPEAVRQEVCDQVASGEKPTHAQIKAKVEKAKPKVRKSPKPAPVPATQDVVIEQIVDLFKQLDRHHQDRCRLLLRNVQAGRA